MLANTSSLCLNMKQPEPVQLCQLRWIIGRVGRKAVAARASCSANTDFRVEMALLQPAGSRHRTHNFSRRYTSTDDLLLQGASFVLPVFIARVWFMASHMLL